MNKNPEPTESEKEAERLRSLASEAYASGNQDDAMSYFLQALNIEEKLPSWPFIRPSQLCQVVEYTARGEFPDGEIDVSIPKPYWDAVKTAVSIAEQWESKGIPYTEIVGGKAHTGFNTYIYIARPNPISTRFFEARSLGNIDIILASVSVIPMTLGVPNLMLSSLGDKGLQQLDDRLIRNFSGPESEWFINRDKVSRLTKNEKGETIIEYVDRYDYEPPTLLPQVEIDQPQDDETVFSVLIKGGEAHGMWTMIVQHEEEGQTKDDFFSEWPSPGEPAKIHSTIDQAVLRICQHFKVGKIVFDSTESQKLEHMIRKTLADAGFSIVGLPSGAINP